MPVNRSPRTPPPYVKDNVSKSKINTRSSKTDDVTAKISDSSSSSTTKETKNMMQKEMLLFKQQINELFLDKFNFMKNIIDETNNNVKILVEDNKKIKAELVELKQMKTAATKDEIKINIPSYADTLKTSGPVVVITPKDVLQKSDKTKNDIKNKMDPTNTQINGIRHAAKGAIVIECKDNESREQVKSDAVKELGVGYSVVIPKPKNYKIKICGISEKLSEDEIIDCLIKQNKYLKAEDEIKVVKTIEIKKPKCDIRYQTLIETNRDTYKRIMEANKLFIKWDSCKVFEHISVVRCFKCLGFNHVQKYCTKKLSCKYCAGEHASSDCKTSDQLQCVNCLWHVNNLNVNLNVQHDAFSKECPVLERKLLQEKRKIYATE